MVEALGYAKTPGQPAPHPEARGMEAREGPFMWSALPAAGFAIVEAANATPKAPRAGRESQPLEKSVQI